jgi:hypothetical protein
MTIDFLPDPKRGALNKFNILFPNFNPYSISSQNSMINIFKKYLTNDDSNNNNNSNNSNGDSNDINKIKEEKKENLNLKESPILAFISKMVPINIKNINDETTNTQNFKQLNLTDKNSEIRYMAFARAYCGTIKKGQEYFVIGPKHDPKSNHYDIKKFKFDKLYIFMGQTLEQISEVPPGNIFSVSGLENSIFKTATIASEFDCPSIKPSIISLNSIIKVCIVTEELKEMPILIEGLKKLNRSDPAVEYYVQKNGEHILVTSGEVHLERCIKDLEDHLAKVKFRISAPMVNFKEGLSNFSYQYKKKKMQTENRAKKELINADEKKKDLNYYYVMGEGEGNIDIDNQDEILKSSTPMILTEKNKIKKLEKVNNKVVDIKNKIEKTNFYIEKNFNKKMLNNSNKEKSEILNNVNIIEKKFTKNFAEDTTPNKICSFIISTVGMNEQQLEFLEKNQDIMEEIVKNEGNLSDAIFENFLEFKKNLLDLFEDKKIRTLIEKNLLCFGPNGYGKNMLLIRNLKNDKNYFNKIQNLKVNIDNLNKKNIDLNNNNNINNENNNNITSEEHEEISELKNEGNFILFLYILFYNFILIYFKLYLLNLIILIIFLCL